MTERKTERERGVSHKPSSAAISNDKAEELFCNAVNYELMSKGGTRKPYARFLISLAHCHLFMSKVNHFRSGNFSVTYQLLVQLVHLSMHLRIHRRSPFAKSGFVSTQKYVYENMVVGNELTLTAVLR